MVVSITRGSNDINCDVLQDKMNCSYVCELFAIAVFSGGAFNGDDSVPTRRYCPGLAVGGENNIGTVLRMLSSTAVANNSCAAL